MVIHPFKTLACARTRTGVLALVVLSVATLALVLMPDAALAANIGDNASGGVRGASPAGKNIAELLRGFLIPVGYTVGGAIAIGAWVRRDFIGMLPLLGMSIVTGVFLIDGGINALLNISQDVVSAIPST